jgi:hypothetical protein
VRTCLCVCVSEPLRSLIHVRPFLCGDLTAKQTNKHAITSDGQGAPCVLSVVPSHLFPLSLLHTYLRTRTSALYLSRPLRLFIELLLFCFPTHSTVPAFPSLSSSFQVRYPLRLRSLSLFFFNRRLTHDKQQSFKKKKAHFSTYTPTPAHTHTHTNLFIEASCLAVKAASGTRCRRRCVVPPCSRAAPRWPLAVVRA